MTNGNSTRPTEIKRYDIGTNGDAEDIESWECPEGYWMRADDVIAAGASERADADTEGAKLNEAAWASDDHVEFPGRLIATPASSAGASERADAEKDAGLTESDISRIWQKTTGTYASDCPWDVHGFARAILATNKEPEC